MRPFPCFIFFLFLSSLSLFAQDAGRYKVYKRNGDVLTCNKVSGGKTIVCKTSDGEKVSLKPAELMYYTSHDTLKYIVPSDGQTYEVIIENDSVYLTSFEKEVNGTYFEDYFIFRKQNNYEIMEIKKTIAALDALKMYFGGYCSEVDKRIIQYTPKFKKAKFPYEEWIDLIWYYRFYCK